MVRLTSRGLGLGIVALIAAGCVLDPLDDIAESPNERDGGEDSGAGRDSGTKPMRADASVLADAAMQSDAGMRADAAADAGADASSGPCRPPDGAECDPVARCGCDMGERCEVRPLAGGTGAVLRADVARCFPDRGGNRPADARCASDADCAAGLTCGGYVCRRYCNGDGDCDGEACSPGADAEGKRVEGLRMCLTACDPAEPGGCEEHTVCLPTTLTIWPNAFCYGAPEGSQVTEENQPLYAVCDMADDRFPSCEDGLICIGGQTSHHGHCLPYCHDDDDCPAPVPTCSKSGSAWADAETEVGYCSAGNQCNEYSTAEPEPYSGPKPWTAAEFESCDTMCGSDLACQTANCPNAAAFHQCIRDAQSICVAALEGSCREEYVALNCCAPCQSAPDFLTCAAQMCPAQYQAWTNCVGTDVDCAAETVQACIQL